MVTHPDLIERVLGTDQEAFSIGPAQREFFSGVEDHAVTTNIGERWRRLRRALHPAFTRERIRRYAPRMRSTIATFVDGWDDGETDDLRREMRILSVRILVTRCLASTSGGTRRS
jgi:cytochrome P450